MRLRLSTLGKRVAGDWRHIVLYTALVLAAVGLLAFKLGSLPGGYSPSEAHTVAQATSWQHILDNPVNAPYSAAVHSLSYLTHNQLYAARVVSALCGLAALGLFYAIARHWYGERTALFGSVLFGTSAWFLHTARLGVPDVLLFGVLALVAAMLWLRKASSGVALLVCFVLSALLLYTPGMVWFIAMGIIWQWVNIDRLFKRNLWAVGVGGLLLVAALVPMGLAVYHHHDIAKVFAGLPAVGWPDVWDCLKRLGGIPLHIFVKNSLQPERWVGTVPILDFFTTAMLFLGGYLYVRHIKLKRFWLVVALLILGVALASLGGSVTLSAVVPFLYLVAAAGAGFMLDRWLTVFPRNTIAQAVGGGLLVAALLATSLYSFRHYYIAWPQAPDTARAFTIPTPSASGTIKQS
jgi:4-amino-4-deoxy-L-arabinose transferase-like glycosyltransferase